MDKLSLDMMGSFIKDYLDPLRPMSILDVGAQSINGSYRTLFERDGWKYIGMDCIDGANVDLVGAESITTQYEVVVSGQTLEHVGRPWELVQQIYEWVVPGGLVCLIAPHAWPAHYYPMDCWRVLPDGMKSLLEWAGFECLSSLSRSICEPKPSHIRRYTPIGHTMGVGRKESA